MYLNRAIKLARRLPYKRNKQRVVALGLNKSGEIISVGQNSYLKSHPTQAKLALEAGMPEKVYLHAEIDAIIRGKGKANKLVIVRINKNGESLPAAPCPVCQLAIERAGIKHVEFT